MCRKPCSLVVPNPSAPPKNKKQSYPCDPSSSVKCPPVLIEFHKTHPYPLFYKIMFESQNITINQELTRKIVQFKNI